MPGAHPDSAKEWRVRFHFYDGGGNELGRNNLPLGSGEVRYGTGPEAAARIAVTDVVFDAEQDDLIHFAVRVNPDSIAGAMETWPVHVPAKVELPEFVPQMMLERIGQLEEQLARLKAAMHHAGLGESITAIGG
jgi:hypothetical protein